MTRTHDLARQVLSASGAAQADAARRLSDELAAHGSVSHGVLLSQLEQGTPAQRIRAARKALRL